MTIPGIYFTSRDLWAELQLRRPLLTCAVHMAPEIQEDYFVWKKVHRGGSSDFPYSYHDADFDYTVTVALLLLAERGTL